VSGPASHEPEWKTRRDRIDPLLRTRGWTIAPFRDDLDTAGLTHHAVTEFETANGPADYAFFVNGLPLAIAEAKKITLGPQNVLTQAERYSKGMTALPFNFRGYRVPFLYSTNGEKLWFHDARHKLNRSREISGFHTPAALAELLARDFEAACRWFAEHPNAHPRLRPYQVEANAAVEQAIADRKRQMLVAMATGTGKTFTLVNQIYRLLKSKAGQRVLFLVDRRARRPGRPRLQRVRGRAGPEVQPDLRGLQPALPARGLRRGVCLRPLRHAAGVPHRPAAKARLRLRLHHPAHGDQPLRPRRRLVGRRRRHQG
jgi:type I restriction enzyme R subunit